MTQPPPNHTPDNNDTFLPNRPSTRAYVRAIVRKSSTATDVTVMNDQAVAASAASKSAAAASSDAAASNDPLSAQPETVAGKDVLLEGTVRVRTGLAWFKPTHGSMVAMNTTLHSQSCASISTGSKPAAVYAAQTWLAHAEVGAPRAPLMRV